MKPNRALILVAAASIAAACFFAGQAYQMRANLRDVAIVRYESDGTTIEVDRNGRVMSEFEPADGEIYDRLNAALKGVDY